MKRVMRNSKCEPEGLLNKLVGVSYRLAKRDLLFRNGILFDGITCITAQIVLRAKAGILWILQAYFYSKE